MSEPLFFAVGMLIALVWGTAVWWFLRALLWEIDPQVRLIWTLVVVLFLTIPSMAMLP